MAAGFTMLLSKIAEIVAWFGKLFLGVFASLWFLVTDFFCWIFDKTTELAVSAVASVNVSGITTSLSAWGQVPADVMNILSLLRLGEAITIISAAIVVRFTLQLIPFVRLGS